MKLREGPLVVLSVVAAVGAFLCGWVGRFLPFRVEQTAMYVSVFLTICWLLTFVTAVFRFKKRALWLLTGLPLACFWPSVYFLIVTACAHDIRACP